MEKKLPRELFSFHSLSRSRNYISFIKSFALRLCRSHTSLEILFSFFVPTFSAGVCMYCCTTFAGIFFLGKSCLVFAFFSANLFSRPATKDWKEKSVLCYFFYDTRQNKNFWFKTRFKSRHWRIPLRFMTNSFRTAHCCVGNQWPQWFLNLPTINLSVGGKQLGRQL